VKRRHRFDRLSAPPALALRGRGSCHDEKASYLGRAL